MPRSSSSEESGRETTNSYISGVSVSINRNKLTLEEALAKITALEAEKAQILTESTAKDTVIEDMKAHAVEKGEQFKKLRDMTAAEKELLSEKELELMKRTEAIEETARQTQEDQKAFRLEQRGTILKNLVAKMARGDEEIAKKIEFNLNKIKDADLAMTEEALTPLVTDSFNMLGSQTTDGLRTAHNTGGNYQGTAPKENGFAESEQGTALSTALFGAEPQA